MHPDYRELIDRRFEVPLSEAGPDKRVSLRDAIERHIRPGQSIHLASTHNRPYGLGHELTRQYWRKDPRFELSCLNLGECFLGFWLGGLMRRGVTTFAGDVWPYPAPNRIINEEWKSGRVELEHWSILSMTLRLLAGALRLPYLPTRSIVGSSMAEENARFGTFREMEDPFDGERIGMVRALRPDLCFLHVPACDQAGNAILTPPEGEGGLGAFAAKDGVILSTEKVVSTEFLREHNHLVKVPARLVRAVVELPFGAHPRGQNNVGVPKLDQYADDYAFLYEGRLRSKKGREALEEWIEETVLSCDSPQKFVERLGAERLHGLRDRAAPGAWREDVARASAGEKGDNEREGALGSDVDQFLGSEMMIVAAGHKLTEISKEEEATTILAGVGAANLAAWLSLHALRDSETPVAAMAEIGYFDYDPRPADPYIFNFKNTPTCVAATDVLHVLGFNVGSGKNLGSLGAAQVDRAGNVNSTCIPGQVHLLGSGGGNDVASASRAVVVTAYSGRDKLKERVDYVTSPGHNVRWLVTDRGLFDKPAGTEELVFAGYYASGPNGCSSAREAVEVMREHVGWDLRARDELQVIAAPTPEELRMLRLFDPYRQFIR